MILMRVLLLSA